MSKKENLQRLLIQPEDFQIIEAQWDRWERASRSHEAWATIAKICAQFMEGDQWTEEEKRILDAEGRPCVTKNKIAPLVRLILGFFRQNRYEVRYMAASDAASSDEIAEILISQAKQISEAQQSKWKDAQVFQDGITTARGFWDHRMNFDRNRLGEVGEMVLDPFSVYIDPEACQYDPNDPDDPWTYWMHNRWMSIEDIFLMYGDKAMESALTLGTAFPVTSGNYYDIGTAEITPSRFFGLDEAFRTDYDYGFGAGKNIFDHVNRSRKLIRVLDCQHRVLKKVRFFTDLETGDERHIPDDWPIEKIQRIMQYAQMKELPLAFGSGLRKAVRWTVTAADRVLYDEWAPYEGFTITPYFPYFRRGKTRGMIEDLLDPQREINKRSSAMLHIIMSTANSGWMYEEGALEEDMERALEEEGARPGVHIKYQSGKNPPEKIQPTATPMNMKRLEDDANADLKEIGGINDSALGNLDRVQSGRAIVARQKQSIIGAEIYFDNFGRSRELKGRQVKDLIQKFYTEPRLLRARGEGKDEETWINRRNAAGDIVNNVTLGSYITVVDEAPVSATMEQSQFDEALDLHEKGIPIPPDILIDLSSMPRKEEIKDRLDEERIQGEVMRRLEALGIKMQMGIPPEAPVPPVVTDGSPNVVNINEPPGGGSPLLPSGGPMPPAAPNGAPVDPGMQPPAPMQPQLIPPAAPAILGPNGEPLRR